MTGVEPLLATAATLLIIGVLLKKLSLRFGIPSLLLFLLLGMLAGVDGPGGIYFDDFELARTVAVLALALILFGGGTSTDWKDVRPVLPHAVGMATIGVAITAAVTGVVAAWVLDVPMEIGLLLGVIVSSTDAAAVFSVLRARRAGLKGRLRPLLELESGSNDPMAVFLTVGLLQLITARSESGWSLVPLFFQQMALGAVFGLAFAWLAVRIVNWLSVEYEGVYSVFSLATALLIFSVTTMAGGSGFLAVYIAGIVMANSSFVHKQNLIQFHDAIAWLAQIGMFLVMGLLVTPSHLLPVAASSLLIATALIFVARPAATWIILGATKLNWRELTMISWVGLRGAAPIILATFPFAAGIPEAELIFNVVFFIVLASVLVQGTTIPGVAKRLGVDAPLPASGTSVSAASAGGDNSRSPGTDD